MDRFYEFRDCTMYICVDSHNNYFALVGSFDHAYLGVMAFEISHEYHKAWKRTPFGYVSNLSDIPMPKKFKVIYQYPYNYIRAYNHLKCPVPNFTGITYHRCYIRGIFTKAEYIKNVQKISPSIMGHGCYYDHGKSVPYTQMSAIHGL